MYDTSFEEFSQALTYEATQNDKLEILARQKDQSPDINIEYGELPDGTIDLWLETAASSSSHDDVLGGLTLLLGHRRGAESNDLRTVPFSQETFKKVIASFELPRTYPEAVYHQTAHFAKFSMDHTSEKIGRIGYVFRTLDYVYARYALAITYDASTGISRGILHGMVDGWESQRLLALLQERAAFATHPMLVPIVAAEIATYVSAVTVDAADKRMLDIEIATGQHPYDDEHRVDPMKIDFVKSTRDLNSNSTNLGILEMRMENQRRLFNEIKDIIDELPVLVENEDRRKYLQQISRSLKEQVEYLASQNENLLFRVHHIQRKAQTQLAVVYNFIAQRDNKLNIEVARDSKAIAAASKRDSSAMKTIAVLTIVFLPGTFIAALFSVPMFNWQASGEGAVVSGRIWIYWAFTIPLTIIVIIVWFLWMRRKAITRRKKDNAADEAMMHAMGEKTDNENSSGGATV